MHSVTKLAIAAASAAALVCLPLPAGAEGIGSAGDLRYKRTTATLPQGEPGEATSVSFATRCDKGWTAVGGGTSTRDGGSRGIGADHQGAKRYWYSEPWQSYDVESTATGYAICLRTDAYDANSNSVFDLPEAGGQVYQEAPCEVGSVVSGGIRAIGDPTHFALNASYPIDDTTDKDSVPDDGWRVYTQYAGGDDVGIVVDAHCLGGPAPAYRSKSVSAPAATQTKLRALCPKGRSVIGGGVYADGDASRSRVLTTRPWDSKDAKKVPEDGWFGVVWNTSDKPVNMTVHAICR